jgi:MOSC domain-containing protein YiiM
LPIESPALASPATDFADFGDRNAKLHSMPTIVSIQVGRPQTFDYERPADGRSSRWTTAFFKSPVRGAVQVAELGLTGDEQADRKSHGGIDKAVLAYSADHYAYWRAHLALPDMPFGGFGENLTIADLDENGVCIGDRWRAGAVLFEVSQPRQPCWKMGRRWRMPDLPKQVIRNGKSGWYLRVLDEGQLSAGTQIEFVLRPRPEWTIARAIRLLYHEPDNIAGLKELANVPELSHAWREELLERIARRTG